MTTARESDATTKYTSFDTPKPNSAPPQTYTHIRIYTQIQTGRQTANQPDRERYNVTSCIRTRSVTHTYNMSIYIYSSLIIIYIYIYIMHAVAMRRTPVQNREPAWEVVEGRVGFSGGESVVVVSEWRWVSVICWMNL